MLRVHFHLDSAFSLLEALGERLNSSEELLSPAVPVVVRAIERNFDEEGRPVRWHPLNPKYARYKARYFGSGLKILERTGRLRRSIRTGVEGGAIVASTDVPYAAAHQFGTVFMPARPFLVLTEADQEELARNIANTLSEN